MLPSCWPFCSFFNLCLGLVFSCVKHCKTAIDEIFFKALYGLSEEKWLTFIFGKFSFTDDCSELGCSHFPSFKLPSKCHFYRCSCSDTEISWLISMEIIVKGVYIRLYIYI